MPQSPGERISLEAAWAFMDAAPAPNATERIPLAEAAGRVLAAPVIFVADKPPFDVAFVDGFAVQAQATLGAGGYNPLPLHLRSAGSPIDGGSAAPSMAGVAVPEGADAILPVEYAEIAGGGLDVSEPVARGSGIGRRGAAARAGDAALPAGRRIGAVELALAASAGAMDLVVVRRPRVGLWLAGPKPPAADALGVALAALIARDGGVPGGDAADIWLWVGRSGRGDDDDGAERLAAAGGRLDHHGLAFSPGATVGLGELGGGPLVWLPGDPYAALASYETLAGRLVRRFAGRPAAFPGPVGRYALTRKIASPVGIAEFAPVALDGERATPVAVSPADGLVALARASGFALVPAGCEGFAEGGRIEVAEFAGA